jgi:hypothetical protein
VRETRGTARGHHDREAGTGSLLIKHLFSDGCVMEVLSCGVPSAHTGREWDSLVDIHSQQEIFPMSTLFRALSSVALFLFL